VRFSHLESDDDRRVALTPQFALLFVITTAVGVVMLMFGLEEGRVRVRSRRLERCAACGKVVRATERCTCLDT
jgi:hypothetical protein